MKIRSETEDKDNWNDRIEMKCGLGNWRPEWLQKLANPKVFLINFSLVAIFQGASFTYLIGSMTTLEKRYGILRLRERQHLWTKSDRHLIFVFKIIISLFDFISNKGMAFKVRCLGSFLSQTI